MTILFCYLFIFNNTSDDFTNFSLFQINAILLSLLALAWLAAGSRSPSPLRWPVLVYGIVFALTSFTSIDPRRSFGEGLFLLVAIFLFALSAELVARQLHPTTILFTLSIGGCVAMAFMWLPFIQWYRDWLAFAPGEWIPTIPYRLPNPNVVSMFLNVLAFIGLSGIIHARTWFIRLAAFLFTFSALALSFLSSSRGAWLGLAAGFVLIAILFVRENRLRLSSLWRWLRTRRWLLAGAGVAILLVAAAAGVVLYRQFLHPSHVANLYDARSYLWAPAWQAFVAHPILGQGPFTYMISFLRSASVPPSPIFAHAHNVLLNVLGEEGLIGFFAFLALFIAAVIALVRRMRTAAPDQRFVVWAAIGVLAAFTFHSFFDSFNVEPMGLWAMLVVLGAALAVPQPAAQASLPALSSSAHRWWKRPWWLLLLIAGLWLDYFTFQPFAAGIAAANRFDWQTAARELQLAVDRDPYSAIAWQQLGLAESALADQGDSSALIAAEQSFQQAAALDPSWAPNQFNLAAIEARLGNLPASLAAARAGIALSPAVARFQLILGAACERSGDPCAVAAYQAALSQRPDWAGAYFWRSSTLRASALAAWQITGQVDQMEGGATAMDPSHAGFYIRQAEGFLSSGRLEDASLAIQQGWLSIVDNLEQTVDLQWCAAELAAARGDLSTAIAKGQDALNRYLNPGVYGPGSTGLDDVYGSHSFRRPTMFLEFVPWLDAIPLPDTWGQHMAALISWYRQTGNNTQADNLQQQLKILIPDF